VNSEDAKLILALYRPDTSDADDPECARALELARRDTALRDWFEHHCARQRVLRAKFRQIPPPAGLADRILAGAKETRPRWDRRWTWALAAAAGLVLLAAVALNLPGILVPDEFENFKSRMVRSALREYRMDLMTNRADRVREFFAMREAPADYVVPKSLDTLALTGGGILRWRSHPVSMMCYNRGDDQMLFLFVIDRAALRNPPPPPDRARRSVMNRLTTLSWTEGDRAYLLAGPEDSVGVVP
jgi:hypothetical protein